VTRQSNGERIVFGRSRCGLLLQDLDLETLKRITQSALLFFEIFFGVDASVDRERKRALRRNSVEGARTGCFA